MHKSKENANGTFSIGKTWNLDDLSAIESFTSATANPDYQAWAGDVGFVITLGKPYYWQAQTDKEKKFFIASLIKIYGKYTNGKSPALSGFDQRELDQVLGGAQTRAPPRQPPPQGRIPPAPLGPGQGGPNGATSSNAHTLMPQSEQSSYAPPQQARVNRGSPMISNGTASPARSFESGPPRSFESGPRPQDQSSLRRLATRNKSQDSVANSFATRSEDAGSLRQRPGSRSGVNGGHISLNAGNNSSLAGNATYRTPTPEQRPEEKPPERRRPPMDPLRPMQQTDKDLVPAPLMSPGMRSRPPAEPTPPPRSMDRMSPRKPSTRRSDTDRSGSSDRTVMHDRENTIAPKDPMGIDAPGAFPASPLDTPPLALTPIPGAAPTTALPPIPSPAPLEPALEPVEEPSRVENPISPPPEPEEDTRPGLGPMIKSKKSKGEIAGAFWKAAAAATAANAFKPRPGGAAERLRLAAAAAAAKGTDEPDGITAVVPAPPRPASVQKAPERESTGPTEPPPRNAERNSNIPEVKVTIPNASRPTSIEPPIKEEPKKSEDFDADVEEIPRRPVVTGNDVKYLASLGVDPSVLDSRSTELAKWLDYFGWVPGEKMRAKTYEEVKIDLERELNEAQAGGWLARFREDDERVGAIKRGIDVAINECDELDNLLTLYSVELSVSSFPPDAMCGRS